jgi:putative GTP pyrophosphokinase
MISRTPEEWVKAYEEKRSLYANFTAKLHKLFEDLLHTHGIEVAQIESRTKAPESFREKIQRSGTSYDAPLVQLTDLSGIRIIAYYLQDVDKIGAMIKREFESFDKTQITDPDHFGYFSIHYVISLSPSRKQLTEWKSYLDLKAEVQVRTVLQHAWAAIDHKLRYKAASEMPRTLKRQLFSLSALLEIADREFSNLKMQSEELVLQYSEDIKKGKYDIELNLSSMDAYLQYTKQHLNWMKIAQEVGFKTYKYSSPKEEEEEQRRLLKTLQDTGITTIRDFDALLNEARNWGKDTLSQIYRASSKRGFVPYAVPHDILRILTVFGKREYITTSLIEHLGYQDALGQSIAEVANIK